LHAEACYLVQLASAGQHRIAPPKEVALPPPAVAARAAPHCAGAVPLLLTCQAFSVSLLAAQLLLLLLPLLLLLFMLLLLLPLPLLPLPLLLLSLLLLLLLRVAFLTAPAAAVIRAGILRHHLLAWPTADGQGTARLCGEPAALHACGSHCSICRCGLRVAWVCAEAAGRCGAGLGRHTWRLLLLLLLLLLLGRPAVDCRHLIYGSGCWSGRCSRQQLPAARITMLWLHVGAA
jgi:hypothetical protein